MFILFDKLLVYEDVCVCVFVSSNWGPLLAHVKPVSLESPRPQRGDPRAGHDAPHVRTGPLDHLPLSCMRHINRSKAT